MNGENMAKRIKRLSSAQVLALPMGRNDANAATVKDYLKALLIAVWKGGEGFSGKRPFGNSGWEREMIEALVKAEAIDGSCDEDGYLEDYDGIAGDKLIARAINAL